MTLVVNLYAGPGAGKSTLAAGVFHELKNQLVNAELVNEVAKTLVWNEQHNALTNQIYVFGCQTQLQHALRGKVDVIVTDSPLPLARFYKPEHYPDSYNDLIMWSYRQFDNIDFFVERMKPFQQQGRIHNENQSREIDMKVKDMLWDEGIDYTTVPGNRDGVDQIVDRVMRRLGRSA